MPNTLTFNANQLYNEFQWSPFTITTGTILSSPVHSEVIDKNTYVFPFKEGDYVKRKKTMFGTKYPIGVVTNERGFNNYENDDPYVVVNWGNVRKTPIAVKSIVKIELKEIEELL
jgi:hypothetical protein